MPKQIIDGLWLNWKSNKTLGLTFKLKRKIVYLIYLFEKTQEEGSDHKNKDSVRER